MAVVENIITPIVKALVFAGLGIWLLYMIYWVLKHTIKDFKFTMKYKVFRRKYDEEAVNWCMGAISKDWKKVDAEKFLLTHGTKTKKVKEIMYIYNKVEIKMKGGILKNEQLRQGNGQTKIPEIN